jgi:PIN domain nuclease of toxin-antitoxin system
MRLLLDTHIWPWSVMQTRTCLPASEEIEATENELWLSPISIWEVITLSKRGRVVLDEAL